MEFNEYKDEITRAFRHNGLGELIDDEKAEKFFMLSKILIDTNKSFNLTAITDEKEIILKHFIDCASVCELIDYQASLIDIGCGAGFPSLPIAILRNDVKVTSVDSTGKKVNFIADTANRLGLSNIRAVCARAEDFANEGREKYDICTGRAVARLNVLSELCVPFVKVGGKFIAMKASKGEEELAEAISGINILGAELVNHKKISFEYSGILIDREMLVFCKASSTPDRYPRKYSQIIKKPL